ncbi:AAA family ATPase, partial [Nitrosomonas communis]|uniref:AAA family ATPase n=1 Tax=Nitrosomonas communis TaxID=44574 RepID=UPI0034E97BE3|nr:AAA family ATPase [Nitrosomonas communis]
MKLTKLSINNLLGIKEADIENPKKIVFVSGANGAGKSSIRDAVALAMTGDLSRVT